MNEEPPSGPQPREPIPWGKLAEDPEFRSAVSAIVRDIPPLIREGLPIWKEVTTARHKAIGRENIATLVVGAGLVGAVLIAATWLIATNHLSSETGAVIFGTLVVGALGFLRQSGPWWGNGGD